MLNLGRAMLAFPTTGHDISSRFLRSLTELDVYDRERALATWEQAGAPDDWTPLDVRVFDGWFCCEASADLASARNTIVAEFLEHCDSDWLWFCDADMVFKPDTLHKLIARAVQQEIKILGALCVLVTAEGVTPTMFVPDDTAVTRVMLDYPDNEIAELAATGTGCLLIHRDVLIDMREKSESKKFAWFGNDQYHVGTDLECRLGEDVSFCLRARDAGWQVYVDTTLHVGHHKGRRVWMPEDCRWFGTPASYFEGGVKRDTV